MHAQDTAKYHKTLIMVPDEADVLRDAAADILDRDISLRAVARDLRERGVPNTTGTASWSAQSLKRVLLKSAIAGLAVHRGVLRPAPWPVILERDIWERLKAKLEDPARRTSDRGNEPRWLLSGIGLCGGCDDGTTVRATGCVTGRSTRAARAITSSGTPGMPTPTLRFPSSGGRPGRT